MGGRGAISFPIVKLHAFYSRALRPFRENRMRFFCELFRITKETQVLDLGGGAFNWTMVTEIPKLTILDVYDHANKAEWATYVVGDGCRTQFASGSFDIVFSNSVIEHVGGMERQRAFAAECMRCGRAFFVQTPNKWFPLDTHTLAPFIHWLPQRIFRKLLRFTPRFLFFKPDPGDLADFSNMHLLTKREMQELFPGAEIIEERILGMTKSLVAVSAPCRDYRKESSPAGSNELSV
jgi:2-polyprenyl-3-methyl-5-hydroxy-6-metoxy-1,4-benzoquinol methylase